MPSIPKISVIIPIYNPGVYLRPALESVLNQTFQDWECICVDNASTDKSMDVVHEFMDKDSRFVLIQNSENGGVSVGRNIGIDAARGEYITFLDHDDVLCPLAFDMYYNLAKQYNADVVRFDYRFVPQDFVLPDAGSFSSKPKNLIVYQDIQKEIMKFANDRKYRGLYYVWVSFYRRDVIGNLRFIPELRAGGEDNLFMSEIIGNLKCLIQIDNVMLFHRCSETSTTQGDFKSVSVELYRTTIPYAHKKLLAAKNKEIWFDMLYKATMRSFYKMIKKTIKEDKYIDVGRSIVTEFYNTPILHKEYFNLKRRFFIWLYYKGYIKTLRFLMIFL